jgi:hypothetical protein
MLLLGIEGARFHVVPLGFVAKLLRIGPVADLARQITAKRSLFPAMGCPRHN